MTPTTFQRTEVTTTGPARSLIHSAQWLRLCMIDNCICAPGIRCKYIIIAFGHAMINVNDTMLLYIILRKTIEGYLDSVQSLTFKTIKAKLIMHAFHSSRYLQSKWMLYISHA